MAGTEGSILRKEVPASFFCLGKAGNVMENDVYVQWQVVSRNEREDVHLLAPLRKSRLFPFYGWITKALAKICRGGSAKWTQTGQLQCMANGQSLLLSSPWRRFLAHSLGS